MNYENFRDQWHEALQAAGLLTTFPLWPTETFDLRTMDRAYEVILAQNQHARSSLFHVTTTLSWRWDALLSARFATTEEDLLTQLYETRERHEDTARPWLRVDVLLSATVPYGRRVPFPGTETWSHWAARVAAQVSPQFTGDDDADTFDEDMLLVSTALNLNSWCGDPQARVGCSPAGPLYLEGVELSAWRGIFLPRQWDDPERWDAPPDEQLADFFQRIHRALEAWSRGLDDLEAH